MGEKRRIAMPQYVLLLRDDREAVRGNMSPEETRKIVERYLVWGTKPFNLGGKGLVEKTGRVMQKKDGNVNVTEGPYSESREVMGGFYLIEAASFEEAVELSLDNPHLDFGTIEIRDVVLKYD
jgi:hypothetical protein